MSDTETFWVVSVGVLGLAGFVAGSFLCGLPRIDAGLDDALATVHRRRSAVLVGAMLSATGGGLLLWPITAVSTAGSGEAWSSLALFSVAVAALTLSFLVVTSVLAAALAWRDPVDLPRPVARLVLDGLHLATWSVSAPLAAVMIVVTTAVGLQNDLVGLAVVAAAVAKVGTAALEIAGVGTRTGWNAGGWAAGTSGYATVVWFALLIASLA